MSTPADDVPTNRTDPGTLVGPGAPGFYGPFVVLQKLGEGGMGAVYLAHDNRLRRQVAIKTMRPELAAAPASRDRFEREARAAAAVEHDHIVPILHVGEAADGTPFIVMPFLKGEPLDARLKREPVSPLWLLLKVAREVAEGLAAAHAAGLIHRDIKPANIWLEGDPSSPSPSLQVKRCKILDFGLARPVVADSAHLTASGAVMGTPAYMSPEQARAEQLDGRADLFSLGATLYRMATGQPPFRGPNAVAVLIALTTEPPTPVRVAAPAVPVALADLIDQMMSKSPAGRPPSAAIVAAVARMGDETRPAAPSPTPVTPAANPAATPWEEMTETDTGAPAAGVPAAAPRRWPWIAAGLLAGLLGLAAVAVVLRPKAADRGAPEPPPLPPVAVPKPEPWNPANDRKAAEFVFDYGGGLAIDGAEQAVEGRAALPRGPFRLTTISLRNNPQVTDAAMAVFDGCPHLLTVDLFMVPVGDDGVAHLRRCTGLSFLWLLGTKVTDKGMIHFKDCKGLTDLNLSYTGVTDAGLVHFAGCPELVGLHLSHIPVTDAGMIHFKGCKKLRHLNLEASKVTDAGLAVFEGNTELTGLTLGGQGVTDAGLSYFQGCRNLGTAWLQDTAVGDATLAMLADCKSLTEVRLKGTKATAAGVAGLAKALPQAKIEWDGPTYEPGKR
jgi:tRNA A-37 threonylcarbamoyl transferase component Bud32